MLTRDILINLLGILPVKVSPDIALLDEQDCVGHVRKTLEYAVEPGERIRAFLCIPKDLQGQAAGVYCFHQHAGNRLLGKSEVVGLSGDEDQAYASELADCGFVTLAPDAICFEDRCKDKDVPDYSHLHELHTRLIRGQTLLGKVLHDISVGVDVLQALPEVQRDRIGFIGHSYGGRMALFAPVYDRRIQASVCSCGSTSYQDMPSIQFDFVVPGILRHGDLKNIVRLVDPASLLILGGSEDQRWSSGIDEIVQYTQSSFTTGTLESELYPCGHCFTKEMRERAYEFLQRYLLAPPYTS